MPFKMPTEPSKLTGTTRARVTKWKETVSRIDGKPQIQFDFQTDAGNSFSLFMTVTSQKAVETFLDAGILKVVSDDEYDVVPLAQQPKLKVTLENGKLKKFDKII